MKAGLTVEAVTCQYCNEIHFHELAHQMLISLMLMSIIAKISQEQNGKYDTVLFIANGWVDSFYIWCAVWESLMYASSINQGVHNMNVHVTWRVLNARCARATCHVQSVPLHLFTCKLKQTDCKLKLRREIFSCA